MRVLALFVLVGLMALSGCASVVTAQPKQYSPDENGKGLWTIGGTYDRNRHVVTISVNGDNVLSGRFPPYTPRLDLPGSYEGHRLHAECDFTRGVIKHRIAETIYQNVRRNSGNSCQVLVDAKPAATLYF